MLSSISMYIIINLLISPLVSLNHIRSDQMHVATSMEYAQLKYRVRFNILSLYRQAAWVFQYIVLHARH